MKKYVIALVLNLFVFDINCTIAESPLIYNCVDMPFYMEKGEKNNYRGLLIDIFKNSAKNAGFTNYIINMVPPNRMLQNMAEGKAHVWNGVVLPQLKESSIIGTVKLATITLAIYSLDKNVESYNFPTALTDQGLIVIKGFSYGGYLNEIKKLNSNMIIHETRNHESALKMLNMGRAKFLLNYVEPMNLVLEKEVSSKIYYKKVKSLDTYFAVSKKHPKAQNILQELEAGFKKP